MCSAVITLPPWFQLLVPLSSKVKVLLKLCFCVFNLPRFFCCNSTSVFFVYAFAVFYGVKCSMSTLLNSYVSVCNANILERENFQVLPDWMKRLV